MTSSSPNYLSKATPPNTIIVYNKHHKLVLSVMFKIYLSGIE